MQVLFECTHKQLRLFGLVMDARIVAVLLVFYDLANPQNASHYLSQIILVLAGEGGYQHETLKSHGSERRPQLGSCL